MHTSVLYFGVQYDMLYSYPDLGGQNILEQIIEIINNTNYSKAKVLTSITYFLHYYTCSYTTVCFIFFFLPIAHGILCNKSLQ